MRGYEEDEYEGYDDYEDEEDEGEEGDVELEEYEEEEERKPTAEEIEYLGLRERLKERIRKKMQGASGSANSKSLEKKRKIPSDNYGSFFGPSQPVIAPRVIQESKSLLENQHLANRILSSNQSNKKSSSSGTVSKNGPREQLPRAKNPLHTKIQNLKATRDYSFLLSDDAEIPATSKEPAPGNVSAPRSEARFSQVPLKDKQPLGNGGKNMNGGHEERKKIFQNGQVPSRMGSYKATSASKPNVTSVDSRRQLGSNNAIGPGRPSSSKPMLAKRPAVSADRKALASGSKSNLHASQKPSSKLQPPVPKKPVEQKKGLPEPNKPRMMPKQPLTSSRPQISKPVKNTSSNTSLQDRRPKKKPSREFSDGDPEEALSIIRKMFHTDRWRERDISDDDSDMVQVASFDAIQREEKRSALIAKKEDEEQLRLIEEEERREQQRKLAKKRRLHS